MLILESILMGKILKKIHQSVWSAKTLRLRLDIDIIKANGLNTEIFHFVLMGSLILAFILLILLINNKQQFKLINGWGKCGQNEFYNPMHLSAT